MTGRTNTIEVCLHVHQQEIVIVTEKEKETEIETETKKRTGNVREKENVIKRRNVKERERKRKSERRKGKEKKREKGKRKRRKSESVRRSVKEKRIVIVGEVDLQKLKGKIVYLVLHEENLDLPKTQGKKILQIQGIPRTKVTGKKVTYMSCPIVASCTVWEFLCVA